jgi:hypothetical protein
MQVECRSSVGGGGGGGGGGGSRVQDTDMAKLPKWDSFMYVRRHMHVAVRVNETHWGAAA